MGLKWPNSKSNTLTSSIRSISTNINQRSSSQIGIEKYSVLKSQKLRIEFAHLDNILQKFEVLCFRINCEHAQRN